MKRIVIISSALLLAFACSDTPTEEKAPVEEKTENTPENPTEATNDKFEFKKENFVKGVNNPYFTLVPGRKLEFEGTSLNGEKIHKEVIVSNRTQEIEGVTALGVWEREWRNDSLVRDVKNWYAQDKDGNVWLLGAHDLEIFGGFLKSDDYSWKSGENNAHAGIVVPFNAKVGDTFPAENDGHNKLESKILGVDEAITVPHGSLSNCLKVSDYGLGLDNHHEYRYYCKDSGSISLELIPNTNAKLELTKIQDNTPLDGFDVQYEAFKPTLNEDDAKKAALDKIDSAKTATSVELGLWQNKPAYAVSLLDKEDKALLAYIDVNTGAVIKIVEKK